MICLVLRYQNELLLGTINFFKKKLSTTTTTLNFFTHTPELSLGYIWGLKKHAGRRTRPLCNPEFTPTPGFSLRFSGDGIRPLPTRSYLRVSQSVVLVTDTTESTRARLINYFHEYVNVRDRRIGTNVYDVPVTRVKLVFKFCMESGWWRQQSRALGVILGCVMFGNEVPALL